MNAYDIIKTVRVTERGRSGRKHNQYTLVADRHPSARRSSGPWRVVQVKVVRVQHPQVRGKAAVSPPRAAGRDADWKKAIVTLKKGDRIELA